MPLEQAGSAAAGGNNGANASTTATAKTRSRPNSEYVLYSNGEPVAMNSDDGVNYFGTDILGSVRSVTDKYGNVKASYEYDAFGSPYLANLENDVGFGYCGKVYDSATGLYDYGFRDYNSASARFITVDPIRDGSNWYSYCMNDAVNYVDLFGLTSSDVTFNSNVLSNPIIGNKFVSNNWIVGDGWAIATSGATLNGLTQTTGVPWTTTSWNQSRNPTTLQIGETITWNTSLPFSNVTFSEGSTSTTSPTITAQNFSQSSSFASVGMSGGGNSSSGSNTSSQKGAKNNNPGYVVVQFETNVPVTVNGEPSESYYMILAPQDKVKGATDMMMDEYGNIVKVSGHDNQVIDYSKWSKCSLYKFRQNH